MRACSVGVTLSEAELARHDAAIANKTKRARERTPLARLSPIRRGVQQSRGRAAGDSPVLEPANDPREQPATAPYVIRYPVNGTLEIVPFKVTFVHGVVVGGQGEWTTVPYGGNPSNHWSFADPSVLKWGERDCRVGCGGKLISDPELSVVVGALVDGNLGASDCRDARIVTAARRRRYNCGIFYFNNSPKFEQNDLLQSTEGVSLLDTWIVSSIIRFTNIPIYNLATTSGSIRLSYRTLPRRPL
jgi:hypothetical protein